MNHSRFTSAMSCLAGKYSAVISECTRTAVSCLIKHGDPGNVDTDNLLFAFEYFIWHSDMECGCRNVQGHVFCKPNFPTSWPPRQDATLPHPPSRGLVRESMVVAFSAPRLWLHTPFMVPCLHLIYGLIYGSLPNASITSTETRDREYRT